MMCEFLVGRYMSNSLELSQTNTRHPSSCPLYLNLWSRSTLSIALIKCQL